MSFLLSIRIVVISVLYTCYGRASRVTALVNPGFNVGKEIMLGCNKVKIVFVFC